MVGVPILNGYCWCVFVVVSMDGLAAYNGSTFVVGGTSLGVHEGDLEHITVRVDGIRERVLEVNMSSSLKCLIVPRTWCLGSRGGPPPLDASPSIPPVALMVLTLAQQWTCCGC